MTKGNSIGVIVLAAGSSSRLGQAKQLLMFQKKTLLQGVIDITASLSFSCKVLVLGANAGEILNSLDPRNFTIAINKDWTEGIASSIRAGVRQSLALNPGLDHIMLLLTDQPFVTEKLIDSLVRKHLQDGHKITGSQYKSIVGVPAIFDKSLFSELMKLSGDRGASSIIERSRKDVATVKFDLGYFDVDTPEDYSRLLGFSD